MTQPVGTEVVEESPTPAESTEQESTPASPAVSSRMVVQLADPPVTFTNSHIVEDAMSAPNGLFTIEFSYTVNPGAEAGQTFTFQLENTQPKHMNTMSPSLDLYDDEGNLVATSAYDPATRTYTFTLTTFVEGKIDVVGSARFQAVFANNSNWDQGPVIPGHPGNGVGGTTPEVTFTTSAGGPFTDSIVVPRHPDPVQNSYKVGYWNPGGDPEVGNFLTWALNTSADVQVGSTVTAVDTVDPETAGWKFNCDNLAAFTGRFITVTNVECSETQIALTGTITEGSVPGWLPRFSIPAKIVNVQSRYDNTGTITWVRGTDGQTQIAEISAPIIRSVSDTGGGSLVPIVPEVPVVQASVCVDGTSTDPALLVPVSTTSVRYELRSGDPVITGASYQYQVTATALQSNEVFSMNTLPDGWTYLSPKVATFTVEMNKVNASECILADIGPTPSVCVNNAATDPSISVPESTVRYEYAGAAPVVTNNTYTFTVTVRTLIEGDSFTADGLPEGWTFVDVNTATYTLELQKLDDSACLPEASVTPSPTGPVPTATATVTQTPTGTAVPTITPAVTQTVTETPTGTAVPTITPAVTQTVTETPSGTVDPTVTATVGKTPVATTAPVTGLPSTGSGGPISSSMVVGTLAMATLAIVLGLGVRRRTNA